MEFAREAASRLGIKLEDIDFAKLEQRLESQERKRGLGAMKRLSAIVDSGATTWDHSSQQGRLRAIAGEAALPFFKLSIVKDAMSGEFDNFKIGGEPDESSNEYTSGLFNRQRQIAQEREVWLTEVSHKLERISQLRKEANEIEASLAS